MSTRLYTKRSVRTSSVASSFMDSTTTPALSGSVSNTVQIDRGPDMKEFAYSPLTAPQQANWIGWRSWRIATPVTISGPILLAATAKTNTAGASRIYMEVWKRTYGGSDVDTLIASGTMTSDINLTTSAQATVTVTPAKPVDLVYGERIIIKIFRVRQTSGFDTETVVLTYDAAASVNNYGCFVEFTENFTLVPGSIRLYHRRTSTIGIGNFLDLIPTAGVTTPGVTAVVATTAGATEKVWTRTSGGITLEWITPRFKRQWIWEDLAQLSLANVNAFESNANANCSIRVKVFHRDGRTGAETQIFQGNVNSELSTSLTGYGPGSSNKIITNVKSFSEDDRIVARYYIIPAPSLTMGGSQTCTLGYDDSANPAYIDLLDLEEFKAETDPTAINITPSGTSMMGFGNGQ
jgi:hypothetical protein